MAARGGGDNKLYDILGVPRSASDNEIKRAYHKLAKEFHPDKNPATAEKFKEISYAYDVLSNPTKKETYDRFGLKGLQEGGEGGDHFGFPGDIFSDLFGGGGSPFGGGGLGGGLGGMFFGGMGGRPRGPPKCENTVKPLKVTLEDLYNGKTFKIKHDRKALCVACQGQGTQNARAPRTCHDCRGSGMKTSYRQLGPGIVQQVQNVCPKCSGNGTIIADKDKCKTCEGSKVIQESKEIEINVDKGMSHNTKISLSGKGDEEPGTIAGDLIYVLQCERHETFERKEDNLIMTHTLSLTEALCGFQFIVKQLDGRSLVVSRPPGLVVSSDSVFMVEDEGFPNYKRPFDKGSLLIKFKVEFPQNHFTDEKNLKILETLLPARPKVDFPVDEDDVEEVNLDDYEPPQANNHSQDSDDDEDGPGPRVGCHQQ